MEHSKEFLMKQKEVVKVVCSLLTLNFSKEKEKECLNILNENKTTTDLFFKSLPKNKYNLTILKFALNNMTNVPLNEFIENAAESKLLEILKFFQSNNINLLNKDNNKKSHVDYFLDSAAKFGYITLDTMMNKLGTEILQENFEQTENVNSYYIKEMKFFLNYIKKIDLKNDKVINSKGYNSLIKSYDFLLNIYDSNINFEFMSENYQFLFTGKELDNFNSTFLFNRLLNYGPLSRTSLSKEEKDEFIRLLDEKKWNPDLSCVQKLAIQENKPLQLDLIKILKLNDLDLIKKLINLNILEKDFGKKLNQDNNCGFQIIFDLEMNKLKNSIYSKLSKTNDHRVKENNDKENFLEKIGVIKTPKNTEIKKEEIISPEDFLLQKTKEMLSTFKMWEEFGINMRLTDSKEIAGVKFFNILNEIKKQNEYSLNDDFYFLSKNIGIPPYIVKDILEKLDSRYTNNKPNIKQNESDFEKEFIKIVSNFINQCQFKDLTKEITLSNEEKNNSKLKF